MRGEHVHDSSLTSACVLGFLFFLWCPKGQYKGVGYSYKISRDHEADNKNCFLSKITQPELRRGGGGRPLLCFCIVQLKAFFSIPVFLQESSFESAEIKTKEIVHNHSVHNFLVPHGRKKAQN